MDSTMIDLVCPFDLSLGGFKPKSAKGGEVKSMLWHECYFAFQRFKVGR